MVEGHLENPHDRFFKDLLGRPGVAADFLANYLPPELLAHLDVTDPEALSGTFVDDDLREHLSDALFRVRDRTGAAALVYVLLEHKSTPWPWTPLQLLRYLVAIWEQARREGHTSLPVIIPVVFYHGQTRWNVATDVAGLVAHHDEPALRAWTPLSGTGRVTCPASVLKSSRAEPCYGRGCRCYVMSLPMSCRSGCGRFFSSLPCWSSRV